MNAVAGATPWRWRHLLAQPHRLPFLLASTILVASALWWAGVWAGVLPPQALPPGLVHAAVVPLGALPLFFAGFLFTAGPRWLQVRGPDARALAAPCLAQGAGWLAWLVAAQAGRLLAAAGLLLAAGGTAIVALRLLRLVRASRAPDRLHAGIACAALFLLVPADLGVGLAVALRQDEIARRLVLTGLWCCTVPVFLAAADRMIAFFGAGVLPGFDARHPRALLATNLLLCAVEAAAPWLPQAATAIGTAECAGGALLLALALAWALHKRPRDLLLMFHAGLAWMGAGFVLAGIARIAQAAGHPQVLALAGLHAFALGGLGSLVLAMVSRVSSAHAGHPHAADALLRTAFWLLQACVVLRIAATLWPAHALGLLRLAALLWAALLLPWALRHASWYGRAPGYHGHAMRPPRPQPSSSP